MSVNGFRNTPTQPLPNLNGGRGGGSGQINQADRDALLAFIRNQPDMGRDGVGKGTGPKSGDLFGRTAGPDATEVAAAKTKLQEGEGKLKGAQSVDDLRGMANEARQAEGTVQRADQAVKDQQAAKQAEADKFQRDRTALLRGGQSCINCHPRNEPAFRDLSSLSAFGRQEPPARDPNALSSRLDDAVKAADTIKQTQEKLNSPDPKVKAAAIAHQLAHPRELSDAINKLGPIKDSPAGQQLRQQTQDIAAKAKPEELAKILDANPDLKSYPDKSLTGDLANLRILNDPKLQPAIEKVAKNALDNAQGGPANPLLPSNAKANPDLARLITPFANSDNPADRQKVDGLVRAAAHQSLQDNLRGVTGEKGMEAALSRYQQGMADLGAVGADPGAIAKHTEAALHQNRDKIEKQVDEGRSTWEKVKAWVSGKIDNVAGAVKSMAGKAADACVQQAYEALDQSALGPQDPKFKDENAGMMGKLITNRLEMGESIGIGLSASGKVAGVSVGAGASMEMKRVPKLDNKGNPMAAGPDGKPPSLIQIKLQVDANAGVGIEASFSKSVQKDGVGAGITAECKAEAGIKGSAQLTLTFDANNPADMRQLQEMFGEAATAGLKSTIPGVGPLLASGNAQNVAKIGAAHVEKLRIEAGAYAGVEAKAEARVGDGVKESKTDYTGRKDTPEEKAAKDLKKAETEKADKAEQEKIDKMSPTEKATYMLQKKGAAAAVDKLKEAIPTQKVGVNAAMKGEVSYVREWNFKTGDTSDGIITKGEARAGANFNKNEAGVGVATDREVLRTRDKNGQLKEITIKDTQTKSDFVQYGHKDIMGRIDSDTLARVEQSDSVTITRRATDPKSFEGMNLLEVRQGMAALADNNGPTPSLETRSVTATHKQTAEVGFKVLGTGIQLQIFHARERELLARK